MHLTFKEWQAHTYFWKIVFGVIPNRVIPCTCGKCDVTRWDVMVETISDLQNQNRGVNLEMTKLEIVRACGYFVGGDT